MAGVSRLRLACSCCWGCWPGDHRWAATPGLLLPLAAGGHRASMIRYVALKDLFLQLENLLSEREHFSLKFQPAKLFAVKLLLQFGLTTCVLRGIHLS